MAVSIPVCGNKCKDFRPACGKRVTMPWPYPSWMDVWATLRVNLKALMTAAKAGQRDGPDGVLALEEDCGVGKSTIYRVLDPKQKYDLGLENLHRIAASYGLPAWALLLPKLQKAKADVVRRRSKKDTTK